MYKKSKNKTISIVKHHRRKKQKPMSYNKKNIIALNIQFMIHPPPLRKGSRVALVATARKVTPGEIQPSVELLRSWSLEPVVPDSLFAADHQLAGSDAQRAATLQHFINDNSIEALFCVRGGYGTVRIVDQIDFSPLVRHPKWIVGYSDVTVLHSHVGRHCNLATLHATMPVNIPADPACWNAPAIESLRRALFERSADITTEAGPLNRNGRCQAQVVGGNLSILYSLCGSDSDIETDGKILLIEDLDEYLYHIDRMMQNLKRTGKLHRLKGLIVGAMNEMHDNAVPFGRQAEEIIYDTVREYCYPVAFHVPIGHIGTDNRALILGADTTLEINDTHTRITQSC
ncbi:MAG: muramoyltetrapeptide carboxypeptidase [bacterium P3]|nr:MAG: muramoyltetrapeptide carboxypeptidase [bacterium P3]KWW42423.1 MAG: muramoyltetrapeptide carboxypeptidase [bacterium F083]